MRNIHDWCISRQLWWGHRIPAWHCRTCKQITVARATPAQCVHCAGKDLDQEKDVLDTWFSSGLLPCSVFGWPRHTHDLDVFYPTQLLVTGFDILFFWVARMIMLGCHFMLDVPMPDGSERTLKDAVPFRKVHIHALVRDADRQKMSKTKGNVIDPLVLIEKYGTDALRFTLAALAAQGRNIKLAESRVEGYRNFVTKLWNAARFAEMNGCALVRGFDPGACRLTVNRWIVGALADTAVRVAAAIDDYKFNEAAGALYQFVWGTFCDWYLELVKPILAAGADAARAETRASTAWVLGEVVHLLHPVAPFITEELWKQLTAGKGGLLISAPWPSLPPSLIDRAAMAEMEWVVALISAIRTVRSEMNVPAAAELSAFQNVDQVGIDRMNRHNEQIRRLARLQEIAPAKAEPLAGAAGKTVQMVVEGGTIFLDLAGTVDLEKERARLAKEAAGNEGEIDKIQKKLGNEQFLAKAKPEVVEEQRERLAEAQAALSRVRAALDRIGAR
jgi:valyl-tRNA synthetase